MRLYKQLKSTLLPSIAAALALSACVMDDFEENLDVVRLSAGSYYITVDVDEIYDGTRASGDLVNGDDESKEHLIGSGHNYLLFFDSSDKVSEILNLASMDEHPELCDKLTELQIESKYVALFDVDEDYEAPKSCLVVLNGGKYQSGTTLKIGMTKNEVLTQTWAEGDPHLIGRDGEYFTMTNTVYFDASGNKQDAALVPASIIHESSEPANPDKTIHVHVERMVAKATFQYENPDWPLDGTLTVTPDKDEILMFTGFNSNDIPIYNKIIHWKARPTGWGMNAYEYQSHLYRNVSKSSYFGGFNTNSPTLLRSFWSEDPQYGDANYAWQYRKAINYEDGNWPAPKGVPSYVDGENRHLYNFSYQDIVTQGNFGKNVYFPENTYDASGWSQRYDNRVDELAGTHLIVTAELLTDYGDGDGYQAHDLYRDRIGNVYKTEQDVFKALVMQFNHSLRSNSEMKFRIFDWSGANNTKGIPVVAGISGEFSLWYDGAPIDRAFLDNLNLGALGWSSYTVEAPILHGDGQRLLYLDPSKIAIKNEKGNDVQFYDPEEWENVKIHNRTLQQPPLVNGERDWEVIDENDPHGRKKYQEWDPIPIEITHGISYNMIDAIRSMVFEWTGPIDHFNAGRMYYHKPLNITTGIFGSVRNAWYQYVLKDIQNIGTSVDIPTQPIVPDDVDGNNQMIEIYVNIIGWHDKWPDDQDIFVLDN